MGRRARPAVPLQRGLRIGRGCGRRSAGGVQRRCPGGRRHAAGAGLQVPVPGRGSLANQLARGWPSSAAYVVSFFVIAIIWVSHHYVLHNLARAARTAMFVNLLLLMFAAAISFSTAIVARYLHHGGKSGSPFRRRAGRDRGGDRCSVLERHRCRGGTRGDRRLLLRGAHAHRRRSVSGQALARVTDRPRFTTLRAVPAP